MEKNFPLEEQSIYDIYLDNKEIKTYLIPIYQRNYAWEENQISDLIKDVYDSMDKDKNAPYYIGTLVTYKHGDNVYEVIDGQQRLTTIYIILKTFKNLIIPNKLSYSARKKSDTTIKYLGESMELGNEVDEGIRNGYKYAIDAIKEIVGDNKLEDFKKYFFDNVRIIHYNVPKDIDLNHYFEVMNSRGEQLEQHEIVKSRLCENLRDDEMQKFCQVWEACCEMNIYIQQAFAHKEVFGDNLEIFGIKSFEDIETHIEQIEKKSILNLIEGNISKLEENNAKEKSDRFQPIIDFPNFLLIVLKITQMEKEDFEPVKFILDDKELLRQFDNALEKESDKGMFARKFIFNLLKAKFYLDNYIIHHTLNDKERIGDNPWMLQNYSLKNEKEYQNELVHLLSMFEVSFSSKQRKNYLFYCMLYLFQNQETDVKSYTEFLQSLAKKYFYNVYLDTEYLNERNQPVPNAFDSVILSDGKLNVNINIKDSNYKETFTSIYKQGRRDIPLFVFNYTDYVLWKKYADEIRGNKLKKESIARTEFFEELGCSDFSLDFFNYFYFSRTRKTLEHFYPQAKAGKGMPLSTDDINCFGNFAMIGAEANSSGSSWDPKAKLDHYCDSKTDQVSVASLKFKIMMQMCHDNKYNTSLNRLDDLVWNVEDMQKHQMKMLDILIQ